MPCNVLSFIWAPPGARVTLPLYVLLLISKYSTLPRGPCQGPIHSPPQLLLSPGAGRRPAVKILEGGDCPLLLSDARLTRTRSSSRPAAERDDFPAQVGRECDQHE